MKKVNYNELQSIANSLRIDILNTIYHAKSGHIGGSFSSAEILTVLYYYKMNIRPEEPDWEDRDRFILSKGHAAPVLYGTLANKGYFDKSLLQTEFRTVNGILQGHPCIHTPGVDMPGGSLGMGLSSACGIALGARITNKKYRVYVLVGDGESNEGQIWEAAMAAAHHKLDNLVMLLDKNGMQNDGFTNEVMQNDNLCEKFSAFGWNVSSIDGHNVEQIINALDNVEMIKGKPSVIICNTVKAKGVSFMENDIRFHGGCPTKEEYKIALTELESKL